MRAEEISWHQTVPTLYAANGYLKETDPTVAMLHSNASDTKSCDEIRKAAKVPVSWSLLVRHLALRPATAAHLCPVRLEIPFNPLSLWWQTRHHSILKHPLLHHELVILLSTLIVCHIRHIWRFVELGRAIRKPNLLPLPIGPSTTRFSLNVTYRLPVISSEFVLHVTLRIATAATDGKTLARLGIGPLSESGWLSLSLRCWRLCKRIRRR